MCINIVRWDIFVVDVFNENRFLVVSWSRNISLFLVIYVRATCGRAMLEIIHSKVSFCDSFQVETVQLQHFVNVWLEIMFHVLLSYWLSDIFNKWFFEVVLVSRGGQRTWTRVVLVLFLSASDFLATLYCILISTLRRRPLWWIICAGDARAAARSIQELMKCATITRSIRSWIFLIISLEKEVFSSLPMSN